MIPPQPVAQRAVADLKLAAHFGLRYPDRLDGHAEAPADLDLVHIVCHSRMLNKTPPRASPPPWLDCGVPGIL